MKMNLTGAGWYFSASHRDPVRRELHGHTWSVACWWRESDRLDAVDLQDLVKSILKDNFDHKTLPDSMTRAEDIARAIGGLLAGCVRVDISRPDERLFCEVWL